MENNVKYKVLTEVSVEGKNKYYSLIMDEIPFRLEYFLGEVTEADENTFGIFVFDTLKNTRCFLENRREGRVIAKVEPIGKRKTLPDKLTAFNCLPRWDFLNMFIDKEMVGRSTKPLSDFMTELRYAQDHVLSWAIPLGTEIYGAVKTLEILE